MGKWHDDDEPANLDQRQAYRMCARKKPLKSGKAGKLASRFNQRKYKCPICDRWHLTKSKGIK